MIRPAPILASYTYLKKGGELGEWGRIIADTACTELLIDSGAFSAYHAGKPVSLEEYIAWLERFDKAPGVYGYIQMDVPGKWAATQRNLDRMLGAGLMPMPVLTVDAPVEAVKDLVKVNPRTCMAGGRMMFQGQTDWFTQRCAYAKALTGEDSRLHGLAFLRWPLSYRVGLTSADSASFSYGQSAGLWTIFERGALRNVPAKKLRGKRMSELPETWRTYLENCRISNRLWQDEKRMTRGQASFSDFAAQYGHIAMAAYARRKGFLAFQACVSARVTHAACVARHGRPDGMGFDYEATCAEYDRLRQLPIPERVRRAAALMEECNADQPDRPV